jgi:hypothetical protein
MIEETIQKQLFAAEAIALSGTALSVALDLSKTEGLFRAEYLITGDGTIKIEWLESINGTDYYDSYADLASGLTKTSGPGGNGKGLIDIDVKLAMHGKILITETGGSDAVAVSLWLLTR